MEKKRALYLRMLFRSTMMLLMAATAAASSHNLGALVGNITDAATGSSIEGANVSLESTSAKSNYYNNMSSAGGFYLISNVTEGAYDLIAAKSDNDYENAVMLAQNVPGPRVNFTLLKAKDGCNDDCTKADGLCHAECEGKGMCMFNSWETADACNFAAPGLITYESKSVMCCAGAAYLPRKAEPSINCGGNAISIRMPVLFRGRFATMVFTLFDAIGCNSG